MRLSPAIRISLGLVLLTMSLLLVGDLLGLTPDTRRAELTARQTIAETLAVQLSAAASAGRTEVIEDSVRALRQRNAQVLSVALRRADGTTLTQVGDHDGRWTLEPSSRSTSTQVQVPIFAGEQRWGTVEVRFAPLGLQILGFSVPPLWGLFAFLAVSGFGLYLLFMRRTLRYLDPASVIPGRVQAAMDLLAEGVLMLDTDEQVVLANAAFAEMVGRDAKSLLGRRVAELPWLATEHNRDVRSLPWRQAIARRESRTGVSVTLRLREDETRTFVVNATSIFDGQGNLRGAMASFDDVTQLETRNRDLNRARWRR